MKADPKLIAAARELRDRWLEHVNGSGRAGLISQGKYDVSRCLDGSGVAVRALDVKQRRLLREVA